VSIIHALLRWFLDLLAPGTGKRRAASSPAPLARRTDGWYQSPAATACLPPHRSPYSHHAPLDGHASALVRPYLAAHERQCAQQRRRRVALVLAADFGIDLDRNVIGAVGRPTA
jgi:hypothetical protein